jgi:DNA-binding transcriptional MerR regulator
VAAMMTIAEFAKQQGCTPKTIYKRLNRVIPGNTEGITEVKNGKTYITVFGQGVLIGFNPGESEKVIPGNTGLNPVIPGETAFFREQIAALQDELAKEREHSRAMADRVADLAGQLAELSRNNQFLLGAEQTRTNPALIQEPTRKGLFARLFGQKAAKHGYDE